MNLKSDLIKGCKVRLQAFKSTTYIWMLESYIRILSIHLCDKRWKKYYPQIVFQLDCVSRGLKPSFLWDIGPALEVDILNKLILDFKKASLLCSSIYVVIIEEEQFIVNIVTLYKHFELFLSFIKFIDCSSCFDIPVMIDHDSYENVILMLSFVKDKLRHALELHKKGNEYQDLQNILFEKNTIQCPPTVFGVMLGYPAVYWAIDVMKGNCLSNIPLNVYKVKMNCPTLVLKNDYELYSFSVPAGLDLDNFVNDWLVRLSEETGVNFVLCKNSVINSCVQL